MARKRWEVLLELFAAYPPQSFVEIGVKSGRNIKELAKQTTEVVFHAVDPWAPTEGYHWWPDHEHIKNEVSFDRCLALWPKRIKKYKMLSSEAAQLFASGSVDFVFIDGDHRYEYVKEDITLWLPKIKKGGIIAGHDYNNTDIHGNLFKGVDKAVHEAFGDDFKVDSDHVWWREVT